MFALPRYVIKAGTIVVDDGELRAAPAGDTLLVAPEVDPGMRSELDARLLREAFGSSLQLPGRQGRGAPAGRDRHRRAGGIEHPAGHRGSLIMEIDGVTIVDTFAEAFPMTAARAIITADTPEWAEIAGRTMSGYATSVIACDAEAAIERVLDPGATPDGRPGVSVLVFAFSREALEKALVNRVGQCVMTCPTTACYSGLAPGEKTVKVGGSLRYFGDGWQISKRLAGRRYWRVPVMDGEFTCEETFGTLKGVAGGNLILMGTDPAGVLAATETAVRGDARGSPTSSCLSPAGLRGPARRSEASTRRCGPARTRRLRRRSAGSFPPSCRPRSAAPTRSSSTG